MRPAVPTLASESGITEGISVTNQDSHSPATGVRAGSNRAGEG
jgi:hypothetical protein